jgi:hypothetical protein
MQQVEHITRLSEDERSTLDFGQYRHRVDHLNPLTGERIGVVGWFTEAYTAKRYVLAMATDRQNWRFEFRIEREYWQKCLGGF